MAGFGRERGDGDCFGRKSGEMEVSRARRKGKMMVFIVVVGGK